MISDFVKGKKKFDYPSAIQKGIILHRFIDTFTDSHEATREAKEIFRPAYRLYSGAFTDVVYDHFLAVDEYEFAGRLWHTQPKFTMVPGKICRYVSLYERTELALSLPDPVGHR